MGAVFKELQIFCTVFKSKLDTVFEVVLGEIDIIGQIRKANFGLNHPEFCQVTTSMTVLGTERRSKGVHIRQGTGVSFHIQLSRDGQIGTTTEKVGGIINSSNDSFLDSFGGVNLGSRSGGLFRDALLFALGNLLAWLWCLLHIDR
jgi:hypothetical protein